MEACPSSRGRLPRFDEANSYTWARRARGQGQGSAAFDFVKRGPLSATMFWDESGGDFFLDSEARHAPTKSNDCSGSEAKCLGRVASKAGDDINKGAQGRHCGRVRLAGLERHAHARGRVGGRWWGRVIVQATAALGNIN